MTAENNAQECCPKFNPTPWDGTTHEWKEKKFIKDRVRTFFFMPIGFGKTMMRLNEAMERSGATSPDWVCLSEHTSKWNMDILLAVDKEITDTENVTLSGTYFSKVYEGDFKKTETWMKDFESVLAQSNKKSEKTYMWYTTCPKCAKKYGKNYTVIIAKIAQ